MVQLTVWYGVLNSAICMAVVMYQSAYNKLCLTVSCTNDNTTHHVATITSLSLQVLPIISITHSNNTIAYPIINANCSSLKHFVIRHAFEL